MEMGTLEDKKRYVRCNMMIGQVLTPLMRNYMQLTNVPPATVYQTIMESYCAKLRSELSQDQMSVIQTLLTNSYEIFDITLMYKIARDKNFKMIIREMPTRRWGSSPQSTEIRIGDDIERIRLFRQTIMHKPKHIVSKSETDEFFDKFIDVGKRADVHFKTAKTSSYEQQIKDLQYCPIDPETAETLLKIQAENANLIELVKLQRFPVFMGREMEEHIKEIQNGNEPSDRITHIRMAINGLQNPGDIAGVMNSRREEILLACQESLIVFEGASEGSLMLYLRVHNRVFLSDSLFHTEMDRFVDILFKVISLKPETSVHSYFLILNDDSYATDSSSDEENNPYEEIDEKKLVLDLSVRNEVFETDQSARKILDSFFEGAVTVLTGQQIKHNELTAEITLMRLDEDGATVLIGQQIIDDTMTAVSRLSSLDRYATDSSSDKEINPYEDLEILLMRLESRCLDEDDATVLTGQQIIDDTMTAVSRLSSSEFAKRSLECRALWLFVSCLVEILKLLTIAKIHRYRHRKTKQMKCLCVLYIAIGIGKLVAMIVSKLHQIYVIHNKYYNRMEEREMLVQLLISRYIGNNSKYLQLRNKKDLADWKYKKFANKLLEEVEKVNECRYSHTFLKAAKHRNMILATFKYLYFLLKSEYNIQIPQYYPKQVKFNLCFQTQKTEISVRAKCSFKSDRAFIKSIASDTDGTIWIADNRKNIVQLEMKNKMKCLGSKQLDIEIDEIRCLGNSQIVLTSSTKILQLTNDKLDVLKNFYPYRPSAIHVSNENEIIVAISCKTNEKTDKPAIIRLAFNGETKQIYTNHVAQLYIRNIVRSCTTLLEGNICYIDSNMDIDSGDVVNIDINGIIQWKYRGSPVLNTEHHTFNPIEVITTRYNNLLISEKFASALHILTPAGVLLKIVYIIDIGRYSPSVMTIDTRGTLWISTYRENKNTLCAVEISGF